MNNAFDLEVSEHCPQAKVVYDLFHVVAKFGYEVINSIKVDLANQLRDNPKSRQIITWSRWLLLRNPENLSEGHDLRLFSISVLDEMKNKIKVTKRISLDTGIMTTSS